MWFYVDGRLTRITGTQDEVVAAIKALHAAHITVKAARPPEPATPRGYAVASSHMRR